MYIKKTPKSCCFFGHRKIAVTPALTQKLKDAVDYQPRSGAKLAYDYAERKGCEIINLFTKE